MENHLNSDDSIIYAHMYTLFSTESILNFLYHVINLFDNMFQTQSLMKYMYAYFKHLRL